MPKLSKVLLHTLEIYTSVLSISSTSIQHKSTGAWHVSAQTLPFVRPKVSLLWDGPVRRQATVRRVLVHRITPPVDLDTSVAKSEEDDDAREGKTDIQGCGRDVRILGPPGTLAAFDVPVEESAHGEPRSIVDAGCWRVVVGTTEENDPVEIPQQEVLGPTLQRQPGDERQEGTDPEHVQIARVHLAWGKKTHRPDSAPEYGCGEIRSALRAGEVVRLVFLTEFVNVTDHPNEDTDLGDGSEKASDKLGKEDGAPRDLHIICQLHVLRKRDGLEDAGERVELESEGYDRFSGDQVSTDDLAENDEVIGVLVRNSVDDTDREDEDYDQDQGDGDSPDREADLVVLHTRNGHSVDDHGQQSVPPFRDVCVFLHQPGVDVKLGLAPYCTPDGASMEKGDIDRSSC